MGEVRAAVNGSPFHAAVKALLGLQGVPIRREGRVPLRDLHPEELAALGRAAAAPGSPLAEALESSGRAAERPCDERAGSLSPASA